jgi:hypothetical protein
MKKHLAQTPQWSWEHTQPKAEAKRGEEKPGEREKDGHQQRKNQTPAKKPTRFLERIMEHGDA